MKKQWLPALLLAVALLLAGCAGAPAELRDEMYNASAPAAPAPAAPAPMPEAAVAQEAPMMEEMGIADTDAGWGSSAGATGEMYSKADNDYGGRKIIKNASLGIETRAFDEHVAHIRQKVDEMGGYIASSYVNGRKPERYGEPGRYANISVRIPQERMEMFLADTRGLATVTYENNSGEDITSSYYDTESRLNIYETQRERIMALLGKAENMEDIISLETELSRLTYEIESLTTQLTRWDELVKLATVNIDVSEIPPTTPVSSDDSVGTRIDEGFNNSLNGVAVFFEDLFVFLIASSPVLILLAAIAVVVWLLIRRARRRAKTEPKRLKATKGPKDPKNPKKHKTVNSYYEEVQAPETDEAPEKKED